MASAELGAAFTALAEVLRDMSEKRDKREFRERELAFKERQLASMDALRQAQIKRLLRQGGGGGSSGIDALLAQAKEAAGTEEKVPVKPEVQPQEEGGFLQSLMSLFGRTPQNAANMLSDLRGFNVEQDRIMEGGNLRSFIEEEKRKKQKKQQSEKSLSDEEVTNIVNLL